MPYQKDGKRDYKRQWAWQKASPTDQPKHLERQRARRAYDKAGINRDGLDIDHIKPLSKGGSNRSGTRLSKPSINRAKKS